VDEHVIFPAEGGLHLLGEGEIPESERGDEFTSLSESEVGECLGYSSRTFGITMHY
jgi:hypothetical protein